MRVCVCVTCCSSASVQAPSGVDSGEKFWNKLNVPAGQHWYFIPHPELPFPPLLLSSPSLHLISSSSRHLLSTTPTLHLLFTSFLPSLHLLASSHLDLLSISSFPSSSPPLLLPTSSPSLNLFFLFLYVFSFRFCLLLLFHFSLLLLPLQPPPLLPPSRTLSPSHFLFPVGQLPLLPRPLLLIGCVSPGRAPDPSNVSSSSPQQTRQNQRLLHPPSLFV